MQSLKYTNFLLTVIAICLLYQCVKSNSAPVTAAAPSTTKVEIVNKEVPVQVKSVYSNINNKLPVEIQEVRYGITGELPVRVRN